MFLGLTQQGKFTSNGEDKILKLRSDIDWLKVVNWTGSNAGGAASTEFFWQRGMPDGRGIRYFKDAGTNLNVENLASPNGFTLVSNIEQKFGAAQNIAAGGITNQNPPLVNVADTRGLKDGDVIRIYNADGALQLGSIDFTINNVAQAQPGTLRLAYMPAIAQALNANNNGQVRKLLYDPYFYPRRRYITKITQAQQAVVTMSVDHDIKVGQQVRFKIPEDFGMVELNGVSATVVNTGQADADGITNTITIDVDTSGFSAFAFPATGDVPFTAAQVIPYGQDTPESLDQGVYVSNGATENQGYIGVRLAGGANSPAGPAAGNEMYWIAGKSFTVDNQ